MSVKSELPQPTQYRNSVYRNIYTIKESQALFDDLVLNPAQIPVLQTWDNESSGIDHSQPPSHRPFQYADLATIDILIDPRKWGSSRFSDGTFGVWYGAEEEATSIRESLFHAYQFAKPDFDSSNFPIIIERKMFSAQLDSDRTVDLRKISNSEELVSNDFAFCQEIGRLARESSFSMYLTRSARNTGGTCTPVFIPECLRSDKTLYFLKFSFLNPNEVRITRDIDEVSQIPIEWK